MSEDKFNSELWEQLANKELRGNPPEAFKPLDQVSIKSVYSKSDLNKLEHTDSTPGVPHLFEGLEQRCTLEAPWTIRQYAGFSTAEESNAFYKKALSAEVKV